MRDLHVIRSGVMLLLVAIGLSGCTALVVGGAGVGAGGYYVAKSERTLGEIASDARITSAVNSKFLTDDMVSAIGINVDTHKGVVTLKGTVNNQAVARRAYDLAYSVEGVSQVFTKLTIRSEPMSAWGPVGR
jgi:hyperosmotically inducible protein